MSGYEWKQNVLDDTISEKRNHILAITLILLLIVITFILYKYAEMKDDELE